MAQGIFSGGNGSGNNKRTCSDITINTQPSTNTQEIALNTTSTAINVSASSGGPITYQWYTNTIAANTGGVTVGSSNGGTTSSFTPPSNSLGTAYYYCMLSANGCTTVSDVSGPFVVSCTKFNSHPSTSNQYLTINSTPASLSANVTAGSTISYQWYQSLTASNTGGTLITTGGNNSSYLPPTNAIGRYYYYCLASVSGCSPATASNASGFIDVSFPNAFYGGSGKGDAQRTCSDISIGTQPSTNSQNIARNGTAGNLMVGASSSGTITYQWYSNTNQTNIGGISLGSSHGANTHTFTPPTDVLGTTYYYCMLSANGCTTISNVSGPIQINCAGFTAHPSTSSQYLYLNASATGFSVSSNGSGALIYQWYQNDVPLNFGGTIISGASNSAYTPPTNNVGAKYYYCLVGVSGCSPASPSNVSGAVNVTIATAFGGGNGKGDAKNAIASTDLGATWWLTNGTSNYATTSNWNNGALPSNKPAYIPSGGTQPIISTSASIPAEGSLNILSGASLTISPNGLLNVNGLISNEGNFIVTSNASGTGSIGNSSGTITGNVIVERYIPSGNRRFRFLSSPVSSATLNGLIDDIFITGNNGGGGFDVTTTNNPSAFRYDETIITGNADNGWVSFTSLSDNFTPGRGYRILIRGDRSDNGRLDGTVTSQNAVTLDITGTLNQGDITPTYMTYTNSGTAANDGWNLMGNPYASNIDWNAIYDNNDFGNVNPTMYQRNAVSGSYVDYNASSNAGNGSQYINSFSGFFVQFNGTPSATFKENRKTSNAGGSYFKSAINELRIKMKYDSANYDLALIKFTEKGSPIYDKMEDSRKLMNEVMNVFTLSNDDVALSTNLNNTQNLDTSLSIPLSINGPKAKYSLELSGIASFGSNKISIFDKFTQSTLELNKDTTLSFTINEDAQSMNDRFRLLFNKSKPTRLDDIRNVFPKITIYPIPVLEHLNLSIDFKVSLTFEYEIFNQLGAKIKEGSLNFSDNTIHQIDIPNFAQGIYFLRISQDGNVKTLKFIK